MATMTRIFLIVLIQFRHHDFDKAQKTDAKLNQKLVSHKYYTLNNFHEGDQNHRLICRNRKICLPAGLQKKKKGLYHEMLCHLGDTRTEHIIRQNFD